MLQQFTTLHKSLDSVLSTSLITIQYFNQIILVYKEFNIKNITSCEKEFIPIKSSINYIYKYAKTKKLDAPQL